MLHLVRASSMSSAECNAPSEGVGGWEIKRPESARIPWIKETEPLGMALVLSKVNMRSVDRIPPLKFAKNRWK